MNQLKGYVAKAAILLTTLLTLSPSCSALASDYCYGNGMNHNNMASACSEARYNCQRGKCIMRTFTALRERSSKSWPGRHDIGTVREIYNCEVRIDYSCHR